MKKLIKKSFHRKEKGFTLIELLIVIVIIGILAGVLIAVINPVRQQNRSRNAAVRSAILKASFAINTVRAGIGTLPSGTQLREELENITYAPAPLGNNCTSGVALNCLFSMSGTTLPRNCPATGIIPTLNQTNQCYMHIVSTGDAIHQNLLAGKFRIVAAKFMLDPAAPTYDLYVFDSTQGLLECGVGAPYTGVADLTVTATQTHGVNDCMRVNE